MAFVVAVHAHIKHHGAGFDHIGREHIALAHGGHDHIGLPRDGGQIGRAAVADGDGGVLRQQHQRHGLAHDIAAANDHGVLAPQLVADAFEHFHAAIRRAGPEAGHAGHEGAGAGDVEAVHIFGRADGFDHLLRIDMCGQGQLHQNAVNGGVGIEGVHPFQQRRFAHGGVVFFEYRMHAAIAARLDLVAHIHLAGGVVAHQNNGQPGGDTLRLDGGNALRDFGTNLGGQSLAINNLCGHKGFVHG